MAAALVIFFDIGNTLGVPRSNPALVGVDLFPFVPELLARLSASSPTSGQPPRLGIMSNTPAGVTIPHMKAILEAAGILQFLDPSLLVLSSVVGKDKSQTSFFVDGATLANSEPNRCIFVGESHEERAVAAAAGFRTSFHLLHVFHVLTTFA